MLGGTGQMNFMIHTSGSAEDFDSWKISGWEAKSMVAILDRLSCWIPQDGPEVQDEFIGWVIVERMEIGRIAIRRCLDNGKKRSIWWSFTFYLILNQIKQVIEKNHNSITNYCKWLGSINRATSRHLLTSKIDLLSLIDELVRWGLHGCSLRSPVTVWSRQDSVSTAAMPDNRNQSGKNRRRNVAAGGGFSGRWSVAGSTSAGPQSMVEAAGPIRLHGLPKYYTWRLPLEHLPQSPTTGSSTSEFARLASFHCFQGYLNRDLPQNTAWLHSGILVIQVVPFSFSMVSVKYSILLYTLFILLQLLILLLNNDLRSYNLRG